MNTARNLYIGFLILLVIGCGQNRSDVRKKLNFDENWEFQHTGAVLQKSAINDSAWESVNLPHDWAIYEQVDKDNPSTFHGGYFPGGVGWYKKTFQLPTEYKSKAIEILFDGIFMNSDVWINGHHLGHQTNGYISFYYNIQPFINFDGTNEILVRVDNNQQPVDRWYTGCGIYRHVWLLAKEKIHIPVWGTYVTTPEVSRDKAMVDFEVEVINETSQSSNCKVVTEIKDTEGLVVATTESELSIDNGKSERIAQQFTVAEPSLWSPENPVIYVASTSILKDGQVIGQYDTPFGIRDVEFNSEQGFVLNGEKVLLKGVCIHHDAGSVGAAVPDMLIYSRLKTLKELGVNAVRLSHNPHNPVLLDICDTLGLLVIDEMYDKWEIQFLEYNGKTEPFDSLWPTDLARLIDRDKNHPSVILWSVGNETREQRFDPGRGVEILTRLVEFTKQKDPSRKVTCALHPNGEPNGELPSRYIDYVDVVSYNYRIDEIKEWHEKHPDKIWLVSETKAYQEGDATPYREIDYSENSFLKLEPYVAGQFIWAGIDYLGETMGWPYRCFTNGIVRSNGIPKPYAYFTKSVYADEPMVEITVVDEELAHYYDTLQHWQKLWFGSPLVDHWNFPGREKQPMSIITFSNCPQVELFLNGESLGTKLRSEFNDKVIKWEVPYEKGVLVAIGKENGKEVVKDTLAYANNATKMVLKPTQKMLRPNGTDVSEVILRVTDSKNITAPFAENNITIDIEGPGKLIGVDNADPKYHGSFKANHMKARRGMLVLVVQAGKEAGNIKIKASADGLEEGITTIKVAKE